MLKKAGTASAGQVIDLPTTAKQELVAEGSAGQWPARDSESCIREHDALDSSYPNSRWCFVHRDSPRSTDSSSPVFADEPLPAKRPWQS
jgi:hypothetical protein